MIKTVVGFAALPCIFVSGLFLNILELFVYCLIRPFSEKLFRKVNHNLQYFCWSQTVAVVDWCSNITCRIIYADEESKREFGKSSGLVIANHRYDIDWLAAWMLSDKLKTLGNDKAILKSSLKYVPVIGWGWALNDMMFVTRDWNKDRGNIEKSMERLLTYENSLLLAYYEGTRFTEAKHVASLKYAEEKNIPLRFKHHLLPRTKGFIILAKMIRSNYYKYKQENYNKYGLYSMQVGIKSDMPISMLNILLGQQADLSIYVKSIRPEEIPDSDDKIVELLYDIYREKDELHGYFERNGNFPGKINMDYKPRIVTLLNWTFWMSLIYGTLFYYVFTVIYQGLTGGFTTGAMIFLGTTFILLCTITIAIKYMIDSTKVSQSSNYGINNKPKSA